MAWRWAQAGVDAYLCLTALLTMHRNSRLRSPETYWVWLWVPSSVSHKITMDPSSTLQDVTECKEGKDILTIKLKLWFDSYKCLENEFCPGLPGRLPGLANWTDYRPFFFPSHLCVVDLMGLEQVSVHQFCRRLRSPATAVTVVITSLMTWLTFSTLLVPVPLGLNSPIASKYLTFFLKLVLAPNWRCHCFSVLSSGKMTPSCISKIKRFIGSSQ